MMTSELKHSLVLAGCKSYARTFTLTTKLGTNIVDIIVGILYACAHIDDY
jgi:hypothetical protein